MRLQLVCFALTAAAAACSPYSPDLGDVPYLCGVDEPQCPEGYTCQESGGKMVCLSPGGMIPIDAPPATFRCADDSTIEGSSRNDTRETAYFLQTSLTTITLGPLALCPEGDLDHIGINVPAMGNLEAVTTWESGAPVAVKIMGSGGAILNNGVGNGERSTRAYIANLPTGVYYIQVSMDPNSQNNYKLTIKID